MKRLSRPSRLSVIVILMIVTMIAGCVHRQGSNQPVTPYEQVMVWNDTLAQTNNSIAKGLIAVSPSVLPAPKAAIILRAQRSIADIDGKLTTLLKQGPDLAKANSGLIQSYINQIQAAITGLVNSGSIGVRNPNSQQSFDADIQALSSLASNIVNGLKQSGVIP